MLFLKLGLGVGVQLHSRDPTVALPFSGLEENKNSSPCLLTSLQRIWEPQGHVQGDTTKCAGKGSPDTGNAAESPEKMVWKKSCPQGRGMAGDVVGTPYRKPPLENGPASLARDQPIPSNPTRSTRGCVHTVHHG